jgi:uncharacterized coiled-coil DUF342 family protein
MKKLSISLLLTASQLLQAVNPQAFTNAVNAAKANRNEANIENVLRTLDQIVVGPRSKATSAQRQRLQELGLGEYADASNRLELYRLRQASRTPVAGPAAGAPALVIERLEIDPKFAGIKSEVHQLDARQKAIHKVIGNIRIAGGTSDSSKNHLIRELNEVDADLVNLGDTIASQIANPSHSPNIQEDYRALSNKLKQVNRALAQVKVDAKGLRVLADVEAEAAFKAALQKDLDAYNVALTELGKIPAAPGLGIAVIPAPIITEEGSVTISADTAPTIADIPSIKEDIAESKENVDKIPLTPDVADALLDGMVTAIVQEELIKEAAKAAAAVESARLDEEKRQALLEEAATILASYNELKNNLDEYKTHLQANKIQATDFNSAIGRYTTALEKLKKNVADEELRDAATAAYIEANKIYQNYLNDIQAQQAEQKYDSVVRELNTYVTQIEKMFTDPWYRNIPATETLKNFTSSSRDEIKALRDELNTIKNQISRDSTARERLNSIIDEASRKIIGMNADIGQLSRKYHSSAKQSDLQILRDLYLKAYPQHKAIVVKWPSTIAWTQVTAPVAAPAPEEPKAPEVVKPSNGGGTKPAEQPAATNEYVATIQTPKALDDESALLMRLLRTDANKAKAQAIKLEAAANSNGIELSDSIKGTLELIKNWNA